MIIDGSIQWGDEPLPPVANGFNLRARESAIYEWVRQVRGGVLAGACTIEQHLSTAISRFMLGRRIILPEIRDSFEEAMLGPLTFERRINAAILIAPFLLPPDKISDLQRDLGELKTIRNSMAHKPFWFEPAIDSKGEITDLVPFIMRGKKPQPLSTEFVAHLNAQIHTLISVCAELAILATGYPDSNQLNA